MSIQGDVNELYAINKELTSLSKKRKKLNERKKLVEERIKNFLREKEQPGLKHQGVAITLDEKPKRHAKKKNEQQRDALGVLERRGIDNAEEILEEILEARRGYLLPADKLLIKRLKNKK